MFSFMVRGFRVVVIILASCEMLCPVSVSFFQTKIDNSMCTCEYMEKNYNTKWNDRKEKSIILCGNYKRTYRMSFDLRIMIDYSFGIFKSLFSLSPRYKHTIRIWQIFNTHGQSWVFVRIHMSILPNGMLCMDILRGKKSWKIPKR
jgi:hypothetical protein